MFDQGLLPVCAYMSIRSAVGPAGKACPFSLLIISLSVRSARTYGPHSYLSLLLPFSETSLTLSNNHVEVGIPPQHSHRPLCLTVPFSLLFTMLSSYSLSVYLPYCPEHYFSVKLSFITVLTKPSTAPAT